MRYLILGILVFLLNCSNIGTDPIPYDENYSFIGIIDEVKYEENDFTFIKIDDKKFIVSGYHTVAEKDSLFYYERKDSKIIEKGLITKNGAFRSFVMKQCE